MCGIFLSLSRRQHAWPSERLEKLLRDRGPDATGKLKRVRHGSQEAINHEASNEVYLSFLSTVLALRGDSTVEQPFTRSEDDSVLCWNGEAWTVDGHLAGGNDTETVYHVLCKATSLGQTDSEDRATWSSKAAGRVAEAMSRIAGPYAFVFFDSLHGMLYFGRDLLGRRSLLSRVSSDGELFLSSVTDGQPEEGWTEIEANGVYWIDLAAKANPPGRSQKAAFLTLRKPYPTVTDGETHNSVISLSSLNKHVPQTPQVLRIDSPAVAALEEHLLYALGLRILDIPNHPTINHEEQVSQVKLAVLFSGGLDCTVLARLSHLLFPPGQAIDLLNVAFENPRVHKSAKADDQHSPSPYELCPDRITGRASFTELQRACPKRNWRFVAINVPYSETTACRDKVMALMHPHNTEMDLSIANALYFAARGTGVVGSGDQGEAAYTTSARVLLSGLGADELFAGYTRHATAFKRNNYNGLLEEIDLDVGRLGKRNLGRDDRIISSWGREARFPFLDEELVRWALAAPVSDKCGFGEDASEIANDGSDESKALEPGKKVLRCLALKLGMTDVAKEKKRAIQFGARTAKMEVGRIKGTQLLS